MKLISNYLLVVLVINLNSLAFGQPTDEELKTGTFIISDTVKGILGEEAAANFSKVLDANEVIKWKVHVPESYDPNKPFGVMYYSDYRDGKRFPSSLKRSFSEKNFIAIRSMDDMTDSHPYALVNVLSFALIQKYYNISAGRIYMLGSNNGCQAAIETALTYPNIIKGTILSNCANRVKSLENEKRRQLNIQNPFLFIKDENIKMYSFAVSWDIVVKKNGIKRVRNWWYSGSPRKDFLDRRQLNLSIDYMDIESKK